MQSLIQVGRKVDPIIHQALARSSPPDFLPSLDYHFQVGGKRMRAALVMLSCAACGGRVDDALKSAAAVEMIHNYSLVIDDLIDRGTIRRGKPTIRVRVGDSVSLLIAMFYREILDDLIQDSPYPSEIRRTSVRAMKEIIDGERLDLLFEQSGRTDPYLKENRVTDPSLTLYLEMIAKKTASLFKAGSEMGAYSAGATTPTVRAMGLFGWKAGLAFQVIDDVLDVCGSLTGKQQGKDVIEHKLGNGVLILGLKFLPEREKQELMGILRARHVVPRMVKRARALVAKTPAEATCREIAKNCLDDAKIQLGTLRDSTYKESLISLCDGFMSRTF